MLNSVSTTRLPTWFLVNYIEHLSLDGFLFEDQTVLVPDEVWIFSIKFMPLHAAFEKPNNIVIVWILSKT